MIVNQDSVLCCLSLFKKYLLLWENWSEDVEIMNDPDPIIGLIKLIEIL